MKINLLQLDTTRGSALDVMAQADKLIQSSPQSDVYVLPEMWATGFEMEPTSTTDETSRLALQWMKEKAASLHAVIVGSLPVKSDAGFNNRLYWVTDDRPLVAYDKRHLFGIGGESVHYLSGKRRVVVENGGVRFLLLTCYDLRFPVFARCRADYDVLLCVANWPESRQQAWDTLLRARAIENQCYVVGVNRVGTYRNLQYAGGSVVIDPRGVDVVRMDRQEAAATANLRLDAVRDFRTKFPTLKDADDFTLLLD